MLHVGPGNLRPERDMAITRQRYRLPRTTRYQFTEVARGGGKGKGGGNRGSMVVGCGQRGEEGELGEPGRPEGCWSLLGERVEAGWEAGRDEAR
ncbi:hypothetical protein E2C01_081921 [Portunus trituberculatus]|uniref:Uncharacterized protein n=1 Tax=Portunus trituberculatus TaxID=210409 RepID=A0A5B7IR19_PORTR|nr:hypothetical protein [Portunus trituberculatus]